MDTSLTSILIASAGSLATGTITLFIYFRSSKRAFSEERYKKLLAPLFFSLEPYLYKELNDKAREALDSAIEIYNQQSQYAGGRVMEEFRILKSSAIYTNDQFRSLCACIDHEYDYACWIIGLPLRTIFYRLNYGQYKTKTTMVLMFLGVVIASVILMIAAYITVGLLFYLITKDPALISSLAQIS